MKTITRRIAMITCVVLVGVGLTATPAHATGYAVSDTASWGWASATNIQWLQISSVHLAVTVNDSVQDGWCVRVNVRAFDYDGTQRGPTYSFVDCSHDGNANYNPNVGWVVYPYSIYAVSITLCQSNSSGTVQNCRPRKYAYR
jgi:hypothetical protein